MIRIDPFDLFVLDATKVTEWLGPYEIRLRLPAVEQRHIKAGETYRALRRLYDAGLVLRQKRRHGFLPLYKRQPAKILGPRLIGACSTAQIARIIGGGP